MKRTADKKGARIPDDGATGTHQQAENIEVPPGEDATDVSTKTGTTELNNIAGKTANDVGLDRESVVRSQAIADAARRGQKADLAPAVAIGGDAEPASRKRTAIINGVKVEVDVPTVRRNSAVAQFGPESTHPRGTLVNKDGSLHVGVGEAYGVIGDINTPQGKLVNRIIPLDSVQAAG